MVIDQLCSTRGTCGKSTPGGIWCSSLPPLPLFLPFFPSLPQWELDTLFSRGPASVAQASMPFRVFPSSREAGVTCELVSLSGRGLLYWYYDLRVQYLAILKLCVFCILVSNDEKAFKLVYSTIEY